MLIRNMYNLVFVYIKDEIIKMGLLKVYVFVWVRYSFDV